MTDTVEGVIAHANDGGVKLEGEEAYRNFTKPEWRKKPWDEPNKGDTVKLALNNGFVYAIKRVSAGTNGASPMSATSQDSLNRRSALDKAVAAYAARGQDFTDSDVVMTAEFFLTFLEPSEPQGDFDPGPENPFE